MGEVAPVAPAAAAGTEVEPTRRPATSSSSPAAAAAAAAPPPAAAAADPGVLGTVQQSALLSSLPSSLLGSMSAGGTGRHGEMARVLGACDYYATQY